MNKFPLSKRAQILNLLNEDMSMQADLPNRDVSITTISKFPVDAG